MWCCWNTIAFLKIHKLNGKIRHGIMTSSNGNIFRVTGPLWGESTSPRWIPLNRQWRGALMCYKRLSKQSKYRWYEIPCRSFWRHCNECYGEISLGRTHQFSPFVIGCWLSLLNNMDFDVDYSYWEDLQAKHSTKIPREHQVNNIVMVWLSKWLMTFMDGMPAVNGLRWRVCLD